MAVTLQFLAEAVYRYVFAQRSPPAKDVDVKEFYTSCAELCTCDCTEELVNTASSLITTLVSPSKSVTAFCRDARSNCYTNFVTTISYTSNLIKLQGQSWSTLVLSETDELVKTGLYEAEQKVLLIPVSSKRSKRTDIVFVAGHIEGVHQKELLDVLYEHIASCYTRLYKHMNARDKRDGFLATLFSLCADLDERDAADMQIKIMNFLQDDLKCEKCCVLFVEESLQSFFCQVVGNEVLDTEIYLPLRGGFFGTMLRSREPRVMERFSKDEEKNLQNLFKVFVNSFLCVPVISPSSKEVVVLLCACNKASGQRFNELDISNVESCFRYTRTLLTSSLALQRETKAKHECQAMLQIAKNLFSHLDDVTILLSEIIQEARTLTHAERCSVFLVNKETNELVAKVFDGIATKDEGVSELRIPITEGIAGHVASTGQTLNVSNVKEHPLFYSKIDATTGYQTREILCFPIKDDKGEVVGVSQLCNKIKGTGFTKYDVELAERFAVFSGISISHSLLYKQVIEVQCRNQLTNELMTYHMKIHPGSIHKCLRDLPSEITQFDPNFSKFIYTPRTLRDDLKCTASIQMYIDLNLVNRFRISTKTLTRFILMVKEGYRNPSYHNWDHAFSVGHHAYLMAKNLKLGEVFGELEVLALLTASFCHDIDHRGTNNAFQVSSKSTLAALYSSQGSVLEHHHFAQTISILNSGCCNIFENLPKTDYVRVLDLMKETILATDLAHHLQILPNLEEIAADKLEPVNCDAEQKKLILDLCMTACDLSDQTKDWNNTKATAHLIYKEFFSQGDMEKSMGALPALINDRERACVPELQVNFMQHIAGPVYRILSVLFPKYTEAYGRYTSNITRWKLVLNKVRLLQLPNTQGLDFLTEEFERELFSPLTSQNSSETSAAHS